MEDEVSDGFTPHHDFILEDTLYTRPHNRLECAIALYNRPLQVPERVFMGTREELQCHLAQSEAA